MGAEKGATPEKSSLATLRALAGNTELVKVIVASGLLKAGKLVAVILVLPNLREQVWGYDMSEFKAMVDLGLSITAILTSSHFGRFSDTVGRRVAAAALGVFSFAPAWGVLAFGMNEKGLYASCVGLVISGIGVNGNVLLLLASDVTDPADREAAFGAFWGVGMFLRFLLLGVPSLLVVTSPVFSNDPMMVLIYQVVLSALYFLVLASIRVPGKTEAASKPEAQATRARCCTRPSDAVAVLVSPLRLCGQRPLRALALCFFLVAFADDPILNVCNQFFYETLGLIPNGTQHQQDMVDVAASMPQQLLVVPGCFLVGLLAKRWGSLRLLLLMLPLSAGLIGMGAALLFVPEVWFVGVVTVANAYGNLVRVPLQHLVTVLAPEGKHGEVMGMMGAFQQAANMLGNLGVILVTPLLQKSLRNPFWIYYLFAGLVTLLAFIPASALSALEVEGQVKEVEDACAEVEKASSGRAAPGGDIEVPLQQTRELSQSLGALRDLSVSRSLQYLDQ